MLKSTKNDWAVWLFWLIETPILIWLFFFSGFFAFTWRSFPDLIASQKFVLRPEGVLGIILALIIGFLIMYGNITNFKSFYIWVKDKWIRMSQ